MLWAVLNKSWKQHPTKQMYDFTAHLANNTLPPVKKKKKKKKKKKERMRHAMYYWGSEDKFMTFSYGLLHRDPPVLADLS